MQTIPIQFTDNEEIMLLQIVRKHLQDSLVDNRNIYDKLALGDVESAIACLEDKHKKLLAGETMPPFRHIKPSPEFKQKLSELVDAPDSSYMSDFLIRSISALNSGIHARENWVDGTPAPGPELTQPTQ